MEVENYKPINKGCLIGKFDIKIPEWGDLLIRECVLFEKDNKRWVALPSKEYQKDGAKKHFSLIKFSPSVFERLQLSALEKLTKLTLDVAPSVQNVSCDQQSQLPF